jgi:hypothetical protein
MNTRKYNIVFVLVGAAALILSAALPAAAVTVQDREQAIKDWTASLNECEREAFITIVRDDVLFFEGSGRDDMLTYRDILDDIWNQLQDDLAPGKYDQLRTLVGILAMEDDKLEDDGVKDDTVKDDTPCPLEEYYYAAAFDCLGLIFVHMIDTEYYNPGLCRPRSGKRDDWVHKNLSLSFWFGIRGLVGITGIDDDDCCCPVSHQVSENIRLAKLFTLRAVKLSQKRCDDDDSSWKTSLEAAFKLFDISHEISRYCVRYVCRY